MVDGRIVTLQRPRQRVRVVSSSFQPTRLAWATAASWERTPSFCSTARICERTVANATYCCLGDLLGRHALDECGEHAAFA